MKTDILNVALLALLVIAVCPTLARQSDEQPATAPFAATIPNRATSPAPAPEGLVWISGGEFSMGSEPKCDEGCSPATVADALPIHQVYVDGFWMDATVVTNAEFEKFVKATGYVTIAEHAPTEEEFPTAPPENLISVSIVFTPTPRPVALTNHYQWWRYQHGANWQHPKGPESDIEGRESYPVVQIAYADAVAYAKRASDCLPRPSGSLLREEA